MPEEVKNYVAPIAVIPKQSLLRGRLAELEKSYNRKRTDLAKKEVRLEIDKTQKELTECLAKLGRTE